MPEREFIVHITWIQVVNNTILDVLGSGLVRCYNVEEAFQYLQLGWRSRCQENNHTVFTVSMEQKWVGTNGMLNHRLSTASFCDLAAYPDTGLYVLENIIKELLAGNPPKQINYDQCLLTAMLRDSFGGRAFTWVIGCISTDPQDYEDTLKTLNLCLCCRGIKNFVTVNTFADNNTMVFSEKAVLPTAESNLNLQFAASQWIKLVSNAEGLFNKILQSKSLNESDINQVSEWLFLKAECDECFSSDLVMDNKDGTQKQGLPRIAEDTEPSEPSESDVESDSDNSDSDTVFQDKLDKYMEYFREKNDQLFADRCEEFLNNVDSDDITLSETSGSQSLPIMTSHSNSGRRKTIQPGESLSGAELELLRKVAAKAISPESQKILLESHKKDFDPEPKLIERELLKMIDSPVSTEVCKKYRIIKEKYDQKQMLARKLSKEINSSQNQLKELINFCIAKERLIDDISKTMRNTGNNKSRTDKASKHQYQKAKSEVAVVQSKLNIDKTNIKLAQHLQQCKAIIEHYERDDDDTDTMSSIDHNTAREIRKHENKLKAYKKQIEQIKRQLKKDEKRKNTLDVELAKDKMKLDELSDKDSSDRKISSLKHVTNRITYLDTILKDKTSNLEKSELSKESELILRKEIKNLRLTRECLHEQRCSLGHKRKVYKSLSDSEERKLLECEEAIEAIDTAIEYKNGLICGKSPSDSLSDSQFGGAKDNRTRGEKMLMARLDKLSHDEIKSLLYKYFQKVVDLRRACATLEVGVEEAAEDAATWRARAAAAWRHAQRIRNSAQARHYQTVQRFTNGHNTYERALAMSMTTDSEMSDDARRLVNRMELLARCPQGPVIPSQNLRQLMPATNVPVAKVMKEKNKLLDAGGFAYVNIRYLPSFLIWKGRKSQSRSRFRFWFLYCSVLRPWSRSRFGTRL
ncbi:Kinesin-like protein costa [Eumeta japonica]|uniref:Kinesin-like protein costa n=1 Tax=Eumeta variegata TaxID=151549 RepID=A0A4C1YUU8_EUMVA|nr:Kinesin-like protein costa [Eumeta japonica]